VDLESLFSLGEFLTSGGIPRNYIYPFTVAIEALKFSVGNICKNVHEDGGLVDPGEVAGFLLHSLVSFVK
jgi:hypothetical protein